MFLSKYVVAMDECEKFKVRLPKDDVLLLKALVHEQGFESLSDVVREAVSRFISQEYDEESRKKVLSKHIPKIDASDLTSDGTDPGDVIFGAMADAVGIEEKERW